MDYPALVGSRDFEGMTNGLAANISDWRGNSADRNIFIAIF